MSGISSQGSGSGSLKLSAEEILAVRKEHERRVKERLVSGMEGRLLQIRLKECYRREGVNHYEKCRDIAEVYLSKISHIDTPTTPEEMEAIARIEMRRRGMSQG